MGKCNKTHVMGRTWEIGTHTFPIAWVFFISILFSLYGILENAWIFHVFCSTWQIWVSENPCNPQYLGMYKFPEQGNSLWKAISFSGCKFLRKIEVIRKPQQSQEHESIKISYYGYIIGKITLLPYYALRKKCPYSELFW